MFSGQKIKRKKHTKRSSVVINDDLLIDLGPDSINACYQYDVDLSKIQYILQTHAHSDHFDAGHLITRHPDYATQKINPVVLIGSQGTFIVMDKMLKDEERSADLFSMDFQEKLHVSLKLISYLQTIEMGEYSITALDSLHDTCQESLIFFIAYRGQTILYGTDLLDMCEAAYDFLADKRIDILVLDQTYGEELNAGGHLDAEQVKIILERLKRMGSVTDTTQIYATHISHEGNPTHRKMQSLSQKYGYNIAYDGLIITI